MSPSSPSAKKLSSRVRPGVCDVRAKVFLLVSALSSEDFPTFDRPAKAISGGPSGGNWPASRGRPYEITLPSEKLAADLREIGLDDRQIRHALSIQVVAFLRNMPVKLSHNSIFTPARFMIVVC